MSVMMQRNMYVSESPGRWLTPMAFCAVTVLWASAAVGGEIRLKLKTADKVDAVYAIDRAPKGWPKPRYAAVQEDGAWVVTELDEGVYYDLLIETPRGNVEGANLKLIDEIGEEDVPGESFPEMTDKNEKAIREYIAGMKIWENKRRVLAMRGHRKWVKVLMEKLMTEQTSLPSAQPQVFWRVEVWDFRNYTGGWRRHRGYVLLERERLTASQWQRLRFRFDPALGGIYVGDDVPTHVKYELKGEWPKDPWKGQEAPDAEDGEERGAEAEAE